MGKISFYRGQSKNYDISIHGNGIYFALDTAEIIHNGVSYGVTNISLDGYATEEFVNEAVKGLISSGVYQVEQNKFVFTDSKLNEVFSITLPLVTSESDGLMSKEDKSKLDKIEPNAQENKIESIESDLGTVTVEGKVSKLELSSAVSELIKQQAGGDLEELTTKISELEKSDEDILKKFTDDNTTEGSVRYLALDEAKQFVSWNDQE